jgi:hypothetical protein
MGEKKGKKKKTTIIIMKTILPKPSNFTVNYHARFKQRDQNKIKMIETPKTETVLMNALNSSLIRSNVPQIYFHYIFEQNWSLRARMDTLI